MVELNYVDSISHETVRRVKKNELKPWKVKGWVIPPKENSAFVAAMEQVLDVYKRPYDARFPLVNMDESPKKLIGESKIPLPAIPGKERRCDYEYVRNGVCNIFLACEALTGKRYVKVTERKTKKDWAVYMKEISDDYFSDAERITIVMDNLSTHKPASFYEVFEPYLPRLKGYGTD